MLISVVTPTYNRAASYLSATIEAVATAQLPADTALEHIIVDDCSSDQTPELVKSLQKRWPHLKYVRNERNSGLAYSRNHGLALAKGELLIDLDDDDLVTYYGIALRATWLRASSASWLYGEAMQIDESGVLLDEPLLSRAVADADRQFRAFFDGQLFAYAGTRIYYTSVLREIGGWNERLTPNIAEDFELWLHLTATSHEATYLPIPTLFYRKKERSMGIDAVRSGEMQRSVEAVKAHYQPFRDRVRSV